MLFGVLSWGDLGLVFSSGFIGDGFSTLGLFVEIWFSNELEENGSCIGIQFDKSSKSSPLFCWTKGRGSFSCEVSLGILSSLFSGVSDEFLAGSDSSVESLFSILFSWLASYLVGISSVGLLESCVFSSGITGEESLSP